MGLDGMVRTMQANRPAAEVALLTVTEGQKAVGL